MDEEYSNTDPNEIANVIGDSNQAGIENWRETQKLLGVPANEIPRFSTLIPGGSPDG